MKRNIAFILIVVLAASAASACPMLQLFVAGGTYDRTSQTWITSSPSFDLYVVSAFAARRDVIVSMSMGSTDDPKNLSVSFGGNAISNPEWKFGSGPINGALGQFDEGEQISRHYAPSWYTEIHTGAYNVGEMVGDVRPDNYGNYWNPSTHAGHTYAQGQARKFRVEASGAFTFIHFDAYTVDRYGHVTRFAPFTHDAEVVSHMPEPGTLALLDVGLLCLGLVGWRRRRK